MFDRQISWVHFSLALGLGLLPRCIRGGEKLFKLAEVFGNLLGFCVEVSFKLEHAIIDVIEIVMKLMYVDGFCVARGLLLERVRMSASCRREIRSSR